MCRVQPGPARLWSGSGMGPDDTQRNITHITIRLTTPSTHKTQLTRSYVLLAGLTDLREKLGPDLVWKQ